jgi:hypothetical protein
MYGPLIKEIQDYSVANINKAKRRLTFPVFVFFFIKTLQIKYAQKHKDIHKNEIHCRKLPRSKI